MKRHLPALFLGLGLSTAAVLPAAAYPVDCAILLCLAGGWPPSAECAHARAVFIARITPWPVEPPLQIWNCPMRAAFREEPRTPATGHPRDVASRGARPEPRFAVETAPAAALPVKASVLQDAMLSAGPAEIGQPGAARDAMRDLALAAAGGAADVDISGPAFDFVRSIRVWHVEYRHHENRNGNCNESDRSLLGTYGPQGDYRWTRGSAHAAPVWMGIDTACTRGGGIYRGVGVEWLDHQGRPGHELVRY
ncbi:hypothetical protein [Albidovulum sp.]|uniref:hypothetical protein n=1 Tax=Albidovulum sp. TaxID=1872424 RepID=UPI0039B92700